MKNVLVISLAALMFAGVACAATGSPTTSALGRPNVTDNSSSVSHCNVRGVCKSSQAELAPGEGAPMPLCPPGMNCGDQLRQIAGEGAPMPLCPPGMNCGDQLRQIAGEGAPMPLCPPGMNCGDQLRQIAGEDWPVAQDLSLAKVG